jgi:hypothetical protein
MELFLGVVLAVVFAWAVYHFFFAGKKSTKTEIKNEVPYKLEPRTTVESDFKLPKATDQVATQTSTSHGGSSVVAIVDSIVEKSEPRSPELKVVTGSKNKKSSTRKSTTRKSTAGQKPVTAKTSQPVRATKKPTTVKPTTK